MTLSILNLISVEKNSVSAGPEANGSKNIDDSFTIQPPQILKSFKSLLQQNRQNLVNQELQSGKTSPFDSGEIHSLSRSELLSFFNVFNQQIVELNVEQADMADFKEFDFDRFSDEELKELIDYVATQLNFVSGRGTQMQFVRETAANIQLVSGNISKAELAEVVKALNLEPTTKSDIAIPVSIKAIKQWLTNLEGRPEAISSVDKNTTSESLIANIPKPSEQAANSQQTNLNINAEPKTGEVKPLEGIKLTDEFGIKDLSKASRQDISVNKKLVTEAVIKEVGTRNRDGILERESLIKISNDSTASFETKTTGLFNALVKASQNEQSLSPAPTPATSEILTTKPTSSIEFTQPAPLKATQASSNFTQGLALKSDFSPNLAMRIQWIYKQALSSAEIMMDPAELGPMSVKMKHLGGETNLVFSVNNYQTKEMIEENLTKLKELLEQQGISLGEAHVEHNQQGESAEDNKSQEQVASNDIRDESSDSLETAYSSTGLLDTYI